MTQPKVFNHKTEPLQELFVLVAGRENYPDEDGKLQPIRIEYRDAEQANYVRERMYALARIVQRDTPNIPIPRPTITQQGRVLSFSWKAGRYKIEGKILGKLGKGTVEDT